MKLTSLVLAAACGLTVHAQTPAAPEEGDHTPAPLPMEGKKKMDPTRGRERPPARKIKPPVAPPLPDPNRVDPIK